MRIIQPDDEINRRDFPMFRGIPMIKVNASPDQRYGVTLSNGVSRLGGRGAIINTAVEAAKQGIAIEAWTVPGNLESDRHYRAVLIYTEYERRMLLLKESL
jgi:hypothetical protein